MRKALAAALAALLAAPLTAQPPVVVRTLPQSPPPASSANDAAAQARQVDRFARARSNFEAIRDGRRAVSDLTAEELQDVIDLDRRVRGDYPDSRTPEQKCVDAEVARARGQLSPLAWQVIRLKCR